MRELLEYLVLAIVDNKDEVEIIEENISDTEVHFFVNVSDSDKGKVIGKQGKIARSIRILTKAIATKESKKVMVSIGEDVDVK